MLNPEIIGSLVIDMEELTLAQTIEKVDHLMDTGNGDPGRLYHILEFLKNNKPLYHSDQIYLENKLNSSFAIEEEFVEENTILPKVQQLINSNSGDQGRLQHIYDTLSDAKPLYHSDQVYLESKLNPSIKELCIVLVESSKPKQRKEHIPPTPKKIPEKLEEKTNIRGSLPKGWSSTNNTKELTKISKNVENEKQKIEKQRKMSDEINQQRSNLTKLISHREEYEQKITQEKSSLDSQINDEKLKIETQTKLSEDLIAQKKELNQVKKEKIQIIKKIDSEKTKISKELPQQKRQLVQAKLDQEKIEKQVQNEQTLLAKMAKEQKSRLLEQAKIAHEIKLKQIELEKTKQEYDEIASQVNKEKVKFSESSKLKKLIKLQEQDLIKAKEARLHLITIISKEKELISKKSQEEMKKLKSQSKLAKQLKKEEKTVEFLKKKLSLNNLVKSSQLNKILIKSKEQKRIFRRQAL